MKVGVVDMRVEGNKITGRRLFDEKSKESKKKKINFVKTPPFVVLKYERLPSTTHIERPEKISKEKFIYRKR